MRVLRSWLWLPILALLALAGVHILVKTTEISLARNWLSTDLLLLSCGLYIGVHLLRPARTEVQGPEDPGDGRRGVE